MSFVCTRRFMPLFVTQFFGAFNDNFLKTAMLVMVAYKMGKNSAECGALNNLAAALFIFPYFIFSATAGELADKFDKSPYCQWVKLWEVGLMLLAAVGFKFWSLPLLLAVLFMMGTQSTFFSPAKYSLLPVHLKRDELLAGNAWIEGGTYLAIMFGITAGGMTVALPHGEMYCGGILVILAVVGYLASRKIPPAPSADPKLKVRWNIFKQSWRIMHDDVWKQKTVRKCVFSVSVFWLAGSLYVTQLPQFAKDYLGGNETICTTFFIIFSVGIGVGAMLASAIFKGSIKINWAVIWSIVAMALFTFDLAMLALSTPKAERLLSTGESLSGVLFYRTAADLFLLAVCGGIWSVPVQSLMQIASKRRILARVIAGNNIINALFMTLGAIGAALLLQFSVRVGWIFVIVGMADLLAALYTMRLCRRPEWNKRKRRKNEYDKAA